MELLILNKMKKILIVLLFVTTSFSVMAQEISTGGYKGFKISGMGSDDFPDIINIYAKFTPGGICVFSTYVDEKETMLTGRYHIIVRSDRYVIADIKNGILEGEWTKYSSNKSVLEKAFFKNGCYDGEFNLYNSGHEKYTFKDCRMVHYIAYHRNGKLEVERNYENEKLHGVVKTYDESGDLIEESSYNKGKLHGKRVQVIKSDDHTVTSHYNNGILEGEYVSMYNNGKMIKKGTYDSKGKKTGKWLDYDRDGELREEAVYLDDKYHGERRTYYEGALRSVTEFANGINHGKETLYKKYPVLREESVYVDGSRELLKDYNDEGKLRTETHYKNGDRVYRKEYYPDYEAAGSVESFYQYNVIHDKGTTSKSGPFLVKEKTYDKNGKLKSLSLLNEKGEMVVVQEYNTSGAATKTNKEYKKNDLITLKEDASGIIDIEPSIQ